VTDVFIRTSREIVETYYFSAFCQQQVA